MRDRLGVVLEEGEERCAVIRAGGLSYVPRIAFGMAWVLAPMFLFFPLLRLHAAGWAVGGIVALGGMLYLLRLRTQWYGTAIVFTTERCIDIARSGMGPPAITAVRWSEVVDIAAKGSRLRVILRKGLFDMALDGVRNAAAMQQLGNEVHYLQRRSG